MARIVVADDGPGIPSTAAGSAFGRGSRGPGSNGSGLGLSIARALTRRHGGELDLLPSAHGTTFVISWPLAGHDCDGLRSGGRRPSRDAHHGT